MKKAMLFVVSFLFAVSANAATLDLTLAGTGGFLGGASQTINSNNSSDVSASGLGLGVSWYSDFVLESDKDTKAVISFEAIGASLSKHSSINVGFGDASPIFSAGESLSVSAVPIPAALWLFAPALLGFFGLRRKAQNAAVA